MYADIGDYYENKTGYRMHSYLLSFFSLNFSVAQLFTGSIISICLGIVGFDKGAAITPEMLTMFRNHGFPDPRYSAGSGCCCLPVLSSE